MRLRKLYVCDIPQEELNYIVQNCNADLEVEEIAISTPDSKVKVLVVPTNEELAIARETVALVQR